jgi:hypothetical protein
VSKAPRQKIKQRETLFPNGDLGAGV